MVLRLTGRVELAVDLMDHGACMHGCVEVSSNLK